MIGHTYGILMSPRLEEDAKKLFVTSPWIRVKRVPAFF